MCCDCVIDVVTWCEVGGGGYWCLNCLADEEPGACCTYSLEFRNSQNTNQIIKSSLDSREYIELDPALPGHIPHYNPYGDVLGGMKEGESLQEENINSDVPEVISNSSISSEIGRFLLPDGSCVDIICDDCEFPRC